MLLQCRRENEFRGPLPAFLFLVIARERSDRGDPVIIESRIRACIIYWIASFHSQ